jgi:ATP-dependent RNA circularization protein (DNA/RNA ligase family)
MMEKYPKIQTVFKRDMENKGRIIEDKYSLPEIEYLKDNKWIFTEKVDGTNIRIKWTRGIGVLLSGRTNKSQMPTFLTQRLEELFPLEKMDNEITTEVDELCLYGEGYGAKIQKGGGNYKSDGVDFVLFDVFVGGWWLKREDVELIAKSLDIDIVPIVGYGMLMDAVRIVKDGLKSDWGEFNAEGLVMRPQVELKTRAGNRIITKIKHKDFTIK